MSRHEDVLGNVDEEFRFLERLDRELLSHRGDDLLPEAFPRKGGVHGCQSNVGGLGKNRHMHNVRTLFAEGVMLVL